uniref:Uncharacterized protein n=1 Tax=Arundo donax TaxID=35708 RepID=A0A0A9BLP9_ARUDO
MLVFELPVMVVDSTYKHIIVLSH